MITPHKLDLLPVNLQDELFAIVAVKVCNEQVTRTNFAFLVLRRSAVEVHRLSNPGKPRHVQEANLPCPCAGENSFVDFRQLFILHSFYVVYKTLFF